MSEKLDKIKRIIQKNVGTACSITARSGRKNLLFENCVIESAYPEIFVVRLMTVKKKQAKSMTFSYTDLLIKKVSISPVKKVSDEKGA